MKPRTTKILGCISLLLGLFAVVIPFCIAFADDLPQRVQVLLRAGWLGEDALRLLACSTLLLPVSILALIMGILARHSRIGKAGLAISIAALCVPVGAAIGVLMLLVMFLIWPFPVLH